MPNSYLHITHSRIPGRLWVRQKSSAKPLSPAKRTCFLLLLLISPWFIPSSFSPAASLISQRQDKRYLKVFKVLLVLLSLMITAGPGWFAGRHILLGGGSRALGKGKDAKVEELMADQAWLPPTALRGLPRPAAALPTQSSLARVCGFHHTVTQEWWQNCLGPSTTKAPNNACQGRQSLLPRPFIPITHGHCHPPPSFYTQTSVLQDFLTVGSFMLPSSPPILNPSLQTLHPFSPCALKSPFQRIRVTRCPSSITNWSLPSPKGGCFLASISSRGCRFSHRPLDRRQGLGSGFPDATFPCVNSVKAHATWVYHFLSPINAKDLAPKCPSSYFFSLCLILT